MSKTFIYFRLHEENSAREMVSSSTAKILIMFILVEVRYDLIHHISSKATSPIKFGLHNFNF
jgi:hypothetical protein